MSNPDTLKAPRGHSATQRMRGDAKRIYEAGLRAADPGAAIHRLCKNEKDRLRVGEKVIDLSSIQRVLVVGAGKATAPMAGAVEAILGDRISEGLISVKYGHTVPLRHLQTLEAGHPLPDANGVNAAQRIIEIAGRAARRDLVIVLISGGGSALLPLPRPGISLADKQQTTDQLLACGATIHEINAIRKHLSAIKGGHLAQAAAPAMLISLILSDVVGDDLDVIASGPTVPDRTTFGDCLEIIRRYGIESRLPPPVRDLLNAGAAGGVAETPKPGTGLWDHSHHCIVGSNAMALQAAARTAEEMGYRTLRLSSRMEGETRTVAQVHAAIAREVLATGHPLPAPACILSGGETTVVIQGRGKGGRNQEFALSAARSIDGTGAIVILSAGTDGTDGPTDAAGAFADHTTVQRARAAGMRITDYLADNNAYPFFETLGDLLKTGPTGTNVMDLNIVLVRKA